jgi:hypothetical protein
MSEQAHEYIEAFRHTAEREERSPELGELEIIVTPVGRFDPPALERYAARAPNGRRGPLFREPTLGSSEAHLAVVRP